MGTQSLISLVAAPAPSARKLQVYIYYTHIWALQYGYRPLLGTQFLISLVASPATPPLLLFVPPSQKPKKRPVSQEEGSAEEGTASGEAKVVKKKKAANAGNGAANELSYDAIRRSKSRSSKP